MARRVKPWASQPQLAVGPNRALSLTRDIAFLFNPGSGFFDAVRPTRAVTANGVSVTPAGSGARGFKAASNSSVAATFSGSRLSTSNGAGTGDFTILLVADPVASGAGEIMYSCANGAQEFYFMANRRTGGPLSSGYLDVETNSGGAFGIEAAGVVDGRPHIFSFVRNAATQSYLYVDGVQVGVKAAPWTAQMWSSTSSDLVGGYSSGTWGISKSVMLLAGFNRAWSPDEIAEVSSISKVWRLLAPLTKRRKMGFASGGGPTAYPWHYYAQMRQMGA